MIPAPRSVEPGQSLGEVRKALASVHLHHLPVTLGGKLVGLISSNDILKLAEAAESESDAPMDKSITAGDIMNTDVITVNFHATIEDAAKLLSAGGIHALPVVNDNQRLEGIVTSTDLINFVLEASPPPDAPPEMLKRLASLQQVMEAAEHYLNSGQGITEHSRLANAIETARKQR
jgi:CBS domain-containing protein